MLFSAEENLKLVQEQEGVFNACDKEVLEYTVEFNVTEYHTCNMTSHPNRTFSTLQEALDYAKEITDYYSNSILYAEIDMETTAWYIDEEGGEPIPDTIGDVTVCYYKKEI